MKACYRRARGHLRMPEPKEGLSKCGAPWATTGKPEKASSLQRP